MLINVWYSVTLGTSGHELPLWMLCAVLLLSLFNFILIEPFNLKSFNRKSIYLGPFNLKRIQQQIN